MTALLDVNVLIALAWPNHVHHPLARRWFASHRQDGWATCPLTESGFVRVSSNRRVIPEAVTPHEALLVLRRIVALPDHVFWQDDIALSSSEHVAPRKILGYRQVTDVHLLALALHHQGRLVTFDQGIASLVPDGVAADDALWLLTEFDR